MISGSELYDGHAILCYDANKVATPAEAEAEDDLSCSWPVR